MIYILFLLMVYVNCFAQEPTKDIELKDKDLRKIYSDTYHVLQEVSRAIHHKEGILRQNHLGLGSLPIFFSKFNHGRIFL